MELINLCTDRHTANQMKLQFNAHAAVGEIMIGLKHLGNLDKGLFSVALIPLF